MNPFLSRLIVHGQGQPPAIEPRLPGRFETPGYFAGDGEGEVSEYRRREPEAPRAPSLSPTEPVAREPAHADLEPSAQPSPEPTRPQASEPSRRKKRSKAEEKEKPETSSPPAPHPLQAASEASESLQNPLPEPPQNLLPQPPHHSAARRRQTLAGIEDAENLPPLPPAPQPSSPRIQHPRSPEPETAGLEPPRPATALVSRQVDVERDSNLPLAPQLLPHSSPPEAQAPTIQVHIGRIEVRALFGPPPEPPKPSAPSQGLSLEEFLKGRR